MDSLLNFLMFALPGGFIGSVFTWLVGRREHNNDMLSKLQASINMLSEENRKILAENVQLRKENAGLQANLEEILLKQRTLLREVDLLRSEITKLTKKNNETSNQRGTPNTNGGRGNDPRGVRVNKTQGENRVAGGVIDSRLRIPRHTGDNPVREPDVEEVRSEGMPDDPCYHGGGDCGGVGETECPDTEPP